VSLTVDMRLVELLQVFGVAKLVHVLVDEVFGRYVHNVGDPVHQTTPSMSLLIAKFHYTDTDTGPTRTRTFLRRNSVGSVRVRFAAKKPVSVSV